MHRRKNKLTDKQAIEYCMGKGSYEVYKELQRRRIEDENGNIKKRSA